MSVIIDANVVKGFFQRSILGQDTDLTGCPVDALSCLTVDNFAIIDDGNMIFSEWRSVVDKEWFDPWIAKMLIDDLVHFIKVRADADISRQLRALGFPNSRDIWYIRTACSASSQFGKSCLLTEDIDFFSPKDKKNDSKRRSDILTSCSGPVAKFLRKSCNVNVMSVAGFLSIYSQRPETTP